MGISEHLSATLASSYFDGSSSPGSALAIEAHLALCEQCRAEPRLRVHAAPAGRPGTGLLDRILALGAAGAASGGPDFPTSMADGRWRRLVRGVKTLPLRGTSGLGEAVRLVAVDRGASLAFPATGQLAVVLRGVARTSEGDFQRGDIIERPRVRLSRAVADDASGCIYLVVGDADMYRGSFLGLLQGR